MHLENFIKHLTSEKRYSPHTITAYQNDLDQFLSFVAETYEVTDITEVNHQMIRSWIMQLVDNDLSGRSVNRKLSSLKTFYRFLRKNGAIHVNPMLKVLPPKSNKALPEFVSNENMDLLLDGEIFDRDFEGKRDRLIIEMFYFTGMRLSELTALTNEDMDLSKNQIKVLGKRNKERLIPFGNILATSIEDYVTARDKMNVESRQEDVFFVTKRGRKI